MGRQVQRPRYVRSRAGCRWEGRPPRSGSRSPCSEGARGPEGLRLPCGSGRGWAPKGGSGWVQACPGLWFQGASFWVVFPGIHLGLALRTTSRKLRPACLPRGLRHGPPVCGQFRPQRVPACVRALVLGLQPWPCSPAGALPPPGHLPFPRVPPSALSPCCLSSVGPWLSPRPALLSFLPYPSLSPVTSCSFPATRHPPPSLLSVSPPGNLGVLYLGLVPLLVRGRAGHTCPGLPSCLPRDPKPRGQGQPDAECQMTAVPGRRVPTLLLVFAACCSW